MVFFLELDLALFSAEWTTRPYPVCAFVRFVDVAPASIQLSRIGKVGNKSALLVMFSTKVGMAANKTSVMTGFWWNTGH